MKVAELEKKVDLFSLISEYYKPTKVGHNTYRVDPCPVCSKKEHFTIYPETNSYSSYNDCCKGGSVYKFLIEVQGMNENEAYEELCRLANEEIHNRSADIKNASSQSLEVKEAKKTNYTKWMDLLYKNTSDQDKQYFLNRGIPLELIEKYKLCFGQIKDRDHAIIPIYTKGEANYYVGRALDEQEPKYNNAPGEVQLFNIEYLKEKHNEPIFITEGIFDALSLEAIGYKAIATNSANNTSKIEDAIKKANIDNVFLTAFDNDPTGQEAAKKFSYKKINIPKKYKDINEWHISASAEFKESIEEQLPNATKPDNVIDYLESQFNNDIEELKSHGIKKTGFDNLDKEMKGLHPGLHVVGGVSSLGKTTFMQQLADQLAEQGDHILFFSLEQSKFEMVSKSIARTTAKINLNSAVPSVEIRSGKTSEEVTNAITEYKKVAANVNVIEGNFNTNVISIRKYVEQYIKFNDVKPIVIVDYLQIMPGLNDRLSDKQRVDTNVTELKRMSRDLNIIVFVISSLNRGNYLAPIDFESFKESGGIEYTADVVWGLQFEVIHEDVFDSDKKIKEKRKKIQEAKAADPRQIELVCLKNRNGSPSFSCSFSYWSKYDFYKPNNKEITGITLDYSNTYTKPRKRI